MKQSARMKRFIGMALMTMRKFRVIILFFAFFIFLRPLPLPADAHSQSENYYRIVVASDLHYPYKYLKIGPKKGAAILEAKSKVVKDLNSWSDVKEVVLLGDIVAQTGSAAEYAQVKQFLSQIKKPISYLVGNHDYFYDDLMVGKKMIVGSPETQSQKLQRFRDAFGMEKLYYSKKTGNLFLIYLSTDALNSQFGTEISRKQLDWLEDQLAANRHLATIVFFHAPLKGTLENYKPSINTPKAIAQPEQDLDAILHNNSQVLLWTSGHTHTGVTNPSFDSPRNYYRGNILNVHNSDMNRKKIYTNSLYIYQDRVAIRTFNHQASQWIKRLDRVVPLPNS